jgi:hypothetical protein
MADHIQAEIVCPSNKSPKDSEEINEKKARMSSNKSTRGQTEAEKWIEIYRSLFPNDDKSKIPIPCKYYSSLHILNQSYSTLDWFYPKPPSLAAFGNIQSYKQLFRQETLRIVGRMVDLIAEEYGTLDDHFRASLWRTARLEALASPASSNQGSRPMTVVPRKTTNPGKLLLSTVSPTNTNANTQECRSPSPTTIQGLKKGVEVTTPQNAEAYDTSSSNMQGKIRTDYARNEDITPHQRAFKSILQEGGNKVRDNNPFRNNLMHSSHQDGTFFPPPSMQVDNGVGLDFPNSNSPLPNFPPMYSTITLREPENVTAPPSTLSPIQSLNPFGLPWNQGNSASLGLTQPLSHDNVDYHQLYFGNVWPQNHSTGGI